MLTAIYLLHSRIIEECILSIDTYSEGNNIHMVHYDILMLVSKLRKERAKEWRML